MRAAKLVAGLMGRLILCAVGLVAMAVSANAQALDTSPGGSIGVGNPSGAYFSGEIDTIDLFSGNVSLRFPIGPQGARDVSAGLHLTYNSGKRRYWWVPIGEGGYWDGDYDGGWKVDHLGGGRIELYSPILVDCSGDVGTWAHEAVWEDGTGRKHRYQNLSAPGSCTLWSQDTILESVDGDGSVLHAAGLSEGYQPAGIQLKDGRVVALACCYPNGSSTMDGMVTSRNGNVTSVSNDSTGWQMSITDALGRSYGWYSSGGTEGYRVTDSNGDQQVYAIERITPTLSFSCPTGTCQDTLTLVENLTLPNGQTYGFEYSTAGFLAKVTLPSGGYISYVFTQPEIGVTYLSERHVSVDGTNEVVWLFSHGEDGLIVWSPESQGENPTAGPVLHGFNEQGLETLTRFYDTDGETILKEVETTWTVDDVLENDQAVNPKATVTTTWVGSLKQTVTTTYFSSGNVETVSESDWYTGETPTKLRKTVYEYETLAGKHADYELVESVETQKWHPELSTPAYVAEGRTVFVYDEGSLVSRTGGPTVTWERGNVTTIHRYKSASESLAETMVYDVFGNLVSKTINRSSGVNLTTTFGYNDNYGSSYSGSQTYAFPTVVTNPLGQSASIEYDYPTGLVTATTDARNQTTTFTYDELNRPDTIVGPGNLDVNYDYTGPTPGSPTTPTTVTEEVLVASGVKRKAETVADKLGRPVLTILHDPAGNVKVETEYDADGRVKRVSMPYRGSSASDWTETTYDGLNRPTVITNPDSTTREFAYTYNTVTATAEDDLQRRQVFNGIGQLIRVDEPDPSEMEPSLDVPLSTLYTYNAQGALLGVCQYANNSTGACASGAQTRSFTVNWLGQVISETHPESGNTSYEYYNDGLLKTRTDARSITATYSYDAASRMTGVSYSGESGTATPSVSMQYDQNGYTGLLTTMTDGVGTVTMAYNAAGLVTSETRQFTGVLGTVTSSYDYDYVGRLTQVTYPTGRIVKQDYANSSGIGVDRMSALSMKHNSGASSWTSMIGSVTDNAAGQMTARTIGALDETRDFNVRNQLIEIDAKVGSTERLNLTYGYGTSNNNSGRIRSRVDSLSAGHSVSYAYDALGRLSGVTNTDPGWSIAWQYDGHGNRVSQTTSGAHISGKVSGFTHEYDNNDNKLTDEESSIAQYSYDAAGNVTKAPSGAGFDYFTWDAENRMTTVDTNAVVYKYDGMGRRVIRMTATESTYYVYGLTGLMSEFVTLNTGAQQAATNDTIRYIIPEHNGTPTLIVDASGAVVERNRRFPFGEKYDETSNSTNDQKFTTYDRDSATGLDYAMARWYASREGRFMSPDPGNAGADLAVPQSWNGYAYALNDPIGFTDPTGRWSAKIHAEIIDAAFPFLTKDQRDMLKMVSGLQDSVILGGQSSGQAYQHAMCEPGETVFDGHARFQSFVNRGEANARAIQAKANRGVFSSAPLLNSSLSEFGKALHAITDGFSPMHQGCQSWNPFNPKNVYDHLTKESSMTPAQKTAAIQAAQEAFVRTFSVPNDSGSVWGINQFDLLEMFFKTFPGMSNADRILNEHVEVRIITDDILFHPVLP
jgi:RHS repeat-associated protein